MRLGDLVDVHIDCYPHKTFRGRVWVIKGAAASQFSLIPPDNATGNYTKVVQRIPIKIALELEESEKEHLYLFPGMNAEVHIRVR